MKRMIFVLFIFLCGKKINEFLSRCINLFLFAIKKKGLSWILYIDWTLIWMLAAKRSYKMKKIFICYHICRKLSTTLEYGLWSTNKHILHLKLFKADNSFSFIASIPKFNHDSFTGWSISTSVQTSTAQKYWLHQ